MSVVVSRPPAFCNDYIHRDAISRSCSFPSQLTNNKFVTDCNNNNNNTSIMGFTSMGNRSSPSPTNALTSTMSLQLGTLCTNELSSPIAINRHHQQHPKLDRSMSEPVERSSSCGSGQLAERSNSFTSGTISSCNSNSSRYKTELCRPYEENGTCKYGDKCQFAHGIHEMRNLTRHPKYKTELCRTFHTSGFCPYGPRCHFIHNSEENRKLRSKSYSMESPSGDSTPDELSSSQQKLFFNEDIYSTSSSQPSCSPPFNVSTLSESFTFAHHDYQQQQQNRANIQQLNNAYNRAQSPYSNAAIAALFAQQQTRIGTILNDDDVFDMDAKNKGLDSPISDELLDETTRRIELLNLAVRMQGNGHLPLFNRYHNTTD